MGTPEFPLVLQAELADDLELVVDALLLVRAHGLLEGTAEVMACHFEEKGRATTANRRQGFKNTLNRFWLFQMQHALLFPSLIELGNVPL